MKTVGLSTIIVLFSVSAFAGPLDELRQRQKEVRTVKAAFKQEKKTALLKRPIRSAGAFYFKSPVGVRWQYDEGVLVIYDGKNLYVYNSELGEAQKLKGAEEYIGPLVFDIELLMRDYRVVAGTDGGKLSLSLTPRKKMPFESMEMAFAEGSPFPEEVRVKEETGDTTTIRFHDVRINEKLSDKLFTFKAPPGVKVRERGYER